MGVSPISIRDATKALQASISGPKVPPSLPSENRRMLQSFVDEHDGQISSDDSSRLNQELKQFWVKHISGNSQKLGAFAGVIRELRVAMKDEDDVLLWYRNVANPVVCTAGVKKTALEDAQEFILSIMIYDDVDTEARQRARVSNLVCKDLLSVYLSRTKPVSEEQQLVAPENAQISKQIEPILVAFGKKMPKSLFQQLDDLIVPEATRLQGLALLSTFLQVQAPHLYLVMHTPLLDHLLKCLMNDTSTTTLSVALTCLIMLMPHVPGSLPPRLPRLFLIYSRLLCWEKFSPLSTEAQKSLVTDDRIPADDKDPGDIGIDSTWEKCRPGKDVVEAATPELMTYFTYLYGLYPLNFMNYIRKPRRFLKSVNFPSADDFDLDQAVIKSRSDQFRRAHLLHPNFYSLTVEEELIDPKWPKYEASDVVAECHGLVITGKHSTLGPGPPPNGKLPHPPPLPRHTPSAHGSVSPAVSHTSLRSGHSWRDTQSTVVSGISQDAESPVLGPASVDDSSSEFLRPRTAPSDGLAKPSLRPDESPLPIGGTSGMQTFKEKREPLTNLEYLQQKLASLQNDLNFERWHKAQYSQHISQLTRKNVKDATVEAETLNLINANRALKQQLEQVRSAREATIKDSNLTRKQANNLESNMSDRFNKMKQEQEMWAADADELKRLRLEMQNYRNMLTAAEARELNKSHQLEMMQRDMEQFQKVQAQLQEAQRKVRELEFREFDFDHAKRELEIVQSEKETLHKRLQRRDQDYEKSKRVYSDIIAGLEAQMNNGSNYDRPSTSLSVDTHAVQQALTEANSKLAQMKKTHTRLLEKYTDLELEYQSLRTELEELQEEHQLKSIHIHKRSSTSFQDSFDLRSGVLESVYGVESDFGGASSEIGRPLTGISTSDPTPRRYSGSRGLSVNSPLTPVSSGNGGGLTWKSQSTPHSNMIGDSGSRSMGFNTTAPLGPDERSMISEKSGDSNKKKEKIAVNSEVRVFGRGGAQNIKLKAKEEKPNGKQDKAKGGSFKTLKGIAGL